MSTPSAVPLAPGGLPGLAPVLAEHPCPLLFATVSGAHLYGFPSRDSDVDVRGVHLLPLREVVGLRERRETWERTWTPDGVEIDLVTHDLAKFVRLLLRPNGYVLEQLLSPLVVRSSPEHEALAALAPRLVTRYHARHYQGFAGSQWRLFERTGELKPLLYTFRTLLTGVHLMRTGEVVAHLPSLAGQLAEAPAYLGDLVAAKSAAEHGALGGAAGAPSRERLTADVTALRAVLDEAGRSTALPERPPARAAAEDLVVEIRLRGR